MSLLWLLVIVLTLIGVAVGRYPWLRMNRATIALVGATTLIALRAIPLEEAYQAIDMNTILLLFAMMVLNVNLRLAGFFQWVTARVVKWARSPRALLALLLFTSGLLSAFFLNDTIVLMFTPLVIEITSTLRRNPIPYLIGLVSAANIGSAATIVGNPQNMIIGLASGIPFVQFTASLFPASIIGLCLIWGILVTFYRQEFSGVLEFTPQVTVRIYPPLLQKSLLASGLMIVAFVLGTPIPLAALMAASLLLITRRLKPQRVFREIDGSLLVFFASLFIVTRAIETSGFSATLFRLMQPVAERGVAALALVALLLSNLVSNVPAVLLFRPFVPHFPNPTQAWLTLALATTFAGNLTLLGSVANLIVAETARQRGIRLEFMEYLRAGLPITLLSLGMGILWLEFIFR
jgi:Na+/H+ antiporter NhaD/arsenite permease-like protein